MGKPRIAQNSLNFETLISLAEVTSSGLDLNEFWITLKSVESAIDPSNVSLASAKLIWVKQWSQLGMELGQEGDYLVNIGDKIGAASAFFRASIYLQLAERFSPKLTASSLALYNMSVVYFKQGLSLQSPLFVPCEPVSIPYFDNITQNMYSLHCYWCPRSPVGAPGNISRWPTAIALTGYDGSAESTYHELAKLVTAYGVNLLVVEGPGQGSVSRFQSLPFRPDYEVVIAQVLKYVTDNLPTVDESKLVLWGRSFGGYLAPRAFSQLGTIGALVADGGVFDFFQALFCQLPPQAQDLFLQNEAEQFDAYLETARGYALSLDFLLDFGYLGFNVSSPTALFAQFQQYTMANAMDGLQHRPLYINDPALDTATGNQSQIFYAALGATLSPETVIVQLDPLRGAALHCSVGSTLNSGMSIMRWVQTVFR